MKKAIAMLLAVAMTAALAIGGTLAYLTDTDEDVNVMTLGQVKIDQLEYERVDVETEDEDADVQVFHDNKPLLPAVTDKDFTYTPGDSYVNWDQIGKDGYTSDIWDPAKINNEVDKMVFVKNKGDWDAYVRTVFAFEAGSYTTLDEFNAKMHLNLNTTDFTWEWVETPMKIGEGTYFVAVAAYNKVLTPGALTEISLSQIALDKTATNEDVAGFGDTFQVLVQSQAVQAAGFADPDTALNEAFGEIPPDPFENDDPVKGTDLKTALHYLNADPAGTKITASVNNIVFGLNKDYAATVAGSEGVLIDVEQDVPANAYYVENGSYYDIYVLSDDVIYTPEDSTELFFKMENLVTVDTSNLDVSRTKDMTDMFYRCYKLENVDVSKWDTSNVTSMVGVFARCYVLTNVDVSGWDTGKSELFNSMFSDCYKLNLDRDALANWDMSSAVRINHMFYACSVQEELNLSGWDMPNMVTTTHMFADCNNLRSIDLTGWNTPNMVSMDAMFNDCHSLTYLDVSSFDTANCNEFTQVFESCRNLKTIVGLDKWDTGNARTYEELFSGCAVLKEVDLSTFKSRDVVNDFVMEWKGTGWGFLRMFSGMNSLEKMTLSADFSFDGDGKVTTESYKVIIPAPAAKDGFVAKWQNVDTGVTYLPSEVPEETAATYVAYYEPITTP